jgi:hypothetical protein
MSKYPYIQGKQARDNIKCNECLRSGQSGWSLEWRVDWFQGNCEFEKICTDCFDDDYEKRVKAGLWRNRADRQIMSNSI